MGIEHLCWPILLYAEGKLVQVIEMLSFACDSCKTKVGSLGFEDSCLAVR